MTNNELISNIISLRAKVHTTHFSELSALLEELSDVDSETEAMEKIRDTLNEIADGDSLCRDCERHVWWFLTKNQKKLSVDNRGAVHFKTCQGTESAREQGFVKINRGH